MTDISVSFIPTVFTIEDIFPFCTAKMLIFVFWNIDHWTC